MIGVTLQVCDVQVTSGRWRRLVLVQSVLAFIFGTVILVFSINLVAGLV
ncbi:DUF1345 domain-containing protein [Gloeobacter violaceus]|nr:DUF1345 domain-containing protein [Gloeobacter violaceus]